MVWHVGDARISRIEELLGPLFDPVRFFPDYNPAVFEQHSAWLYPHHVDQPSGRIIASMHAWLIETSHHKILVDTCIGNDKDRMPYRDWHRLQSPWLDNLAKAGVTPDEIDFVMCTHLHVDHVGWNTRLRDGQWVPTFPNAKYIFAKAEYEFWQAERQKQISEVDADMSQAVNNQTFDDSVAPIMHLAELVEWPLEAGLAGPIEIIPDLLAITPAPGHTPGSIIINLDTGGEHAVFTGDICHHPIQVYEPHWNSAYCELPAQAAATRHKLLADCAAQHTLMLPAHFGPSHAGYVRDTPGGFAFWFK